MVRCLTLYVMNNSRLPCGLWRRRGRRIELPHRQVRRMWRHLPLRLARTWQGHPDPVARWHGSLSGESPQFQSRFMH